MVRFATGFSLIWH